MSTPATFEEWQKAHYIKCGFISSTTELRLAWDAAVAAERDGKPRLTMTITPDMGANIHADDGVTIYPGDVFHCYKVT